MHYYRSQIWENNIFCIWIFNNYKNNGIDVTVAFLANGNCIACQQQINAMFLSRDISHTYLLHGVVLLEKLTGSRQVKKFPAFYGPGGSIPHSYVPTTCPYP